MLPTRRLSRRAAHALAVALLGVGLLAVNYLASMFPWRLDATAGAFYSLSAGTKALLAGIDEPITLDLYVSDHVATLPVSYKSYTGRVRQLLRYYVAAAPAGKLRLRIVDPRADTPEEEQARAAGLDPQSPPQGGENFYCGLVATQTDQRKSIPLLTPAGESFLEYEISRLIAAVQQPAKPTLGVLSSLPLLGGENPPARIVREWEQAFEVGAIDPASPRLSRNLDALAVIHPAEISPRLQYAIDQFLLAGKPVFVAVDPFLHHAHGGRNGPLPDSSALPAFLRAYGLDFSAGELVSDLAYGARARQTGQEGLTRHPFWLALPAASCSPHSPVSALLDNLLLVESGGLVFAPAGNSQFTPLVESSDQAGLVAVDLAEVAQPDAIARRTSPTGRKTLVALVTGQLPTAFPGGPPPDAPIVAPQLSASRAGSRLIVAADVDWLLDETCLQRTSASDENMRPANDNLALAANVVEYLSGAEALLSIRGKGVSQRRFTVVEKMEAQAIERYNAAASELEERLTATRARIRELHAQPAEGMRLLPRPETVSVLKDFRRQEAILLREQREARRLLHAETDRLETRLLVTNLVVPPLLIGVFGLWYRRHRRNSCSSP